MAATSQPSPNQASQSTSAEKTESAPTSSTEQPEEQPVKDPPVVLEDPPVVTLKDPPAPAQEDPPVATLKDPPAPAQELTYAATEASDDYLLAKRLLNDGDFDNALEVIATAMTTITSLLSEEQVASVHESMAPLYYLYGTTLLYSIEESSDIQTNPGNNGGDDDDDEPDDSQVAWENLETARLIVEQMADDSQELQLDLAQIHLRLGDLQRSNGRYQDAIADYTACLEIRQPILGMYHRKVAEVYHLIGLVYTMMAAEGDIQPSPEQPIQEPAPTLEQIEEYRSKSIQNYVACAKSFAGQIAFLCGENPEVITADASEEEQGGKTTGMDLADLAANASSRTVRAIRGRVKELHSDNDQETIHEFKEMLDEIQETIDEAENSREGIKEVSEMKAKVHAEIAASDAAETNADGSTTTIGFGSASTSAAAAAVPSAASSEKPMMVIKKKKKRDDEGSKMPAQADAKRSKTE